MVDANSAMKMVVKKFYARRLFWVGADMELDKEIEPEKPATENKENEEGGEENEGEEGNDEEEQQEEEGGDEEKEQEGEEEEGEEGAPPKPKFNLIWHSDTNITEAAHKVNSVEQ